MGWTPVVAKDLIEFCKDRGIKSFTLDDMTVEFFEPKAAAPVPMDLSPQALAKVLGDSMPPDSAMMFASTEDMPDLESNPTSKPLESPDMP